MFFDKFLQCVLESKGFLSTFNGYFAMPLEATPGQGPDLSVEGLIEWFRILFVRLERIIVASVYTNVGLGYCESFFHVLA